MCNLKKKSIKCMMVLFGVVFILTNRAEAKQLKVETFPEKMEVGQKKTIKANQVVKWSSLNKKIVIETKRKAKKVTISAKKKGVGILVAQKGKKKVKVKIQIKEKQVPQDNTEQKEVSWEEAMKNGGEVYIIAISGDTVEFSTTKNGEISKYMVLDDTIEIIKNGQVVSKDFLQEGQRVKVEYESHDDMVGGKLWGCKSIIILG